MYKTSSNSTTQYLFFILNEEKFAVKANSVQEIVDYTNITKVPKSNPCVKGVTNIRGDLIAVVDPKIRFNFETTSVKKRTSFIIFKILNKSKHNMLSIAMMVDLVIEVDDIQANDIINKPEFGTKIEEKYIQNIVRYNEEYITVLDIDMVLNIEELSQID